MDEAEACRRGFTLSSFLLRLERAELEFLPSVGEPGLLTLEALLGEALLDESSDAAVRGSLLPLLDIEEETLEAVLARPSALLSAVEVRVKEPVARDPVSPFFYRNRYRK